MYEPKQMDLTGVGKTFVKKLRWIFTVGKIQGVGREFFLFIGGLMQGTNNTVQLCVFDLGEDAPLLHCSAWECFTLQGKYIQQSVNQPQYNAGLMKGMGLCFRLSQSRLLGLQCVLFEQSRQNGVSIEHVELMSCQSLGVFAFPYKTMLTAQRDSNASSALSLPPHLGFIRRQCTVLSDFWPPENVNFFININKFHITG